MFARICFVVSVLLPTVTFAQYYNSAVSSAMGGAGRAAASPADVSYLNPAGIVHIKDFYMGLHYFDQRDSNGNIGFLYGIMFVDATSDAAIPGAFSYAKRRYADSRGVVSEQHYQFSVSGLVVPGVSVGANFARQVQQIDDGNSYADHNYSVGMLWVPDKNFALAMVGYDLARTEQLRMTPKISIGSHYIYKDLLRLRLDFLKQIEGNPENAWLSMAGFEVPAWEDFFLRAGGRWDDLQRKQYLTLGLGWDGPRLGFDYAAQILRNGAGQDKSEQLHYIDFKLFF